MKTVRSINWPKIRSGSSLACEWNVAMRSANGNTIPIVLFSESQRTLVSADAFGGRIWSVRMNSGDVISSSVGGVSAPRYTATRLLVGRATTRVLPCRAIETLRHAPAPIQRSSYGASIGSVLPVPKETLRPSVKSS